jgi:DNA polymerase-3 subunit gamma/tau
MSACPGKVIDHHKVVDNLGVMDRRVMHDISSAVFLKNGAKLIHIVEMVNDSGLDLKKFFSDIILHFRNLNVIKLCGRDNSAINLTDLEKETLAQAVTQLHPDYLGMLLQLLLNEESLVKFSSHTKTAVEMVLLKLIQISPGAQVDQIIGKLDLLAKQIESKLTEQLTSPAGHTQPATPPDSAPMSLEQSSRKEASPKGIAPEKITPKTPSMPMAATATALQTEESQATYTPPPMEPIPKTWPNFLKKIEQKFPFMFALLSKAVVDESSPGSVQVKLYKCSAFDTARLKTKKGELQTLCKNFLEKDLDIAIMSETQSIAKPDKQKASMKVAARNHPLVLDAQRIFDGEIINY